jgi:hypothetical protein
MQYKGTMGLSTCFFKQCYKFCYLPVVLAVQSVRDPFHNHDASTITVAYLEIYLHTSCRLANWNVMAERPELVTSDRRQMTISFLALSHRRHLRQIAKGDYQLHHVCLYVVLLPKLTHSLLMSYIYGAPCKARNFNVVYIWTYVWQRWKPSLSICCAMCQHWINAVSYLKFNI